MIKSIEYNKPWILQRADPYIVKHSDGFYYFTASVPEYDRIIIRKSDTLAGLKEAEEKVIWKKHKLGAMSKHIWAPELHYISGKWYIYFAAGEAVDIWKIRPYVLECDNEDPCNGNWKEIGKLCAADNDQFSFKAFSLDTTIFQINEELYCIWAEKVGVGRQISNIYIAKMESPIKMKTAQILLTTPDYEWERIGYWVNEGPFIIKKKNRIFLTYSASSTGADYCIGMLECDEDKNLLDPISWTKSKNPVLESNPKKGIYGPGHNCFTIDEEGYDIMVYHARTTNNIIGDPLNDPNRHTMLMKLQWDNEGRPVFSYD